MSRGRESNLGQDRKNLTPSRPRLVCENNYGIQLRTKIKQNQNKIEDTLFKKSDTLTYSQEKSKLHPMGGNSYSFPLPEIIFVEFKTETS